MTIDIYYYGNNAGLRNPETGQITVSDSYILEPESLIKHVSSYYSVNSELARCPAFADTVKNTFIIKSPFDFSISYSKNPKTIHIDGNNERHIRDKFFCRSYDTFPFISGTMSYVFVPSKPIEMSQLPAYMSDSPFTKNTTLVPGTFNPYKHPRPLEPAFYVTGTSFEVTQGDHLYYIKFHTTEKINLIPVLPDDRLVQLTDVFSALKAGSKTQNSLAFWYTTGLRYKRAKNIIKYIKNNLL